MQEFSSQFAKWQPDWSPFWEMLRWSTLSAWDGCHGSIMVRKIRVSGGGAGNILWIWQSGPEVLWRKPGLLLMIGTTSVLALRHVPKVVRPAWANMFEICSRNWRSMIDPFPVSRRSWQEKNNDFQEGLVFHDFPFDNTVWPISVVGFPSLRSMWFAMKTRVHYTRRHWHFPWIWPTIRTHELIYCVCTPRSCFQTFHDAFFLEAVSWQKQAWGSLLSMQNQCAQNTFQTKFLGQIECASNDQTFGGVPHVSKFKER